jgi:biopolymer transport protein ExbD
MNLRTGKREEPEINLTSLIDVVLLLLVFFMVTTSFVRQSQVAIRLPEGGAMGETEIQARTLEVMVTDQGGYVVAGKSLLDASPGSLRTAILKVADEYDPGRLVLTADALARHQSVVTAMDVAGRLGYSEISIATVQSDQERR